MKKYWIGTSYVKTTLGIVAGCVIADLLSSLRRELDWLDLWMIGALVLGCVTAALCLTHPVGLLKVFWVEDGVIYEEHVLTHRVRSMPLDAQHAIRRRETRRQPAVSRPRLRFAERRRPACTAEPCTPNSRCLAH